MDEEIISRFFFFRKKSVVMGPARLWFDNSCYFEKWTQMTNDGRYLFRPSRKASLYVITTACHR